jgi:methyl halide transferase
MNEEKNTVEQCCVTSCDKPLDAAYWDAQYKMETIGWDLGEVSPPIKAYVDQIKAKDIAILIPGCGNTYEAEYLLQQGFTNITVLDVSPTLVKALQQKFANNSNIKVIEGDFFNHLGSYDLILEQTFFCAVNPSLRQQYAIKMNEVLNSNGKLVGVLFDKEFEFAGPPFGGCKCKYIGYFEPYFSMPIFEHCYNSHSSRKAIELFIKLIKK